MVLLATRYSGTVVLAWPKDTSLQRGNQSLAIKGSPMMKHFDKYYAEIKLALCIKIKNITLFDFKVQHL